jgi:RNA polymerase sigma-70 factor (ECF subfamily)
VFAAETIRVDPTDADLLRRAARGDDLAFQALVKRHAKYMFALAYSLVGSSADAEDVVQESLTGIYKGMGKFEGRASVRHWLGRIVFRQAARFLNSRGPVRLASLDEIGPEDPRGMDPALAVESAGVAVDRRLDIETLLAKLNSAHRQVIVLRELHGLGYEEIAGVLGVPRGTVESRLSRARAELAEMIRKYSK